MEMPQLNRNNQNYKYRISPYFDSIGISITLISQKADVYSLDAIQSVSVPPIIEPQESDWVIIDNITHPDIETVLAENNIIVPDKVADMKVGLNDYPCYQLTPKAYDLYQNSKKLKAIA
ncbi:hypothetical protein H3966_11220 [Staphylococcus epidermidis]|uniref:hypothetical protein n=1 Tax=Staphylococcus TaxID=1279 RepID=UPI000F40D94B|nr:MULTISPECIES: hypothetical protein [Staphylococcus]MBF2226358.1 hypothetical protein [Staphylococcus epidermidis]MCD9074476.1 hypothetical protein [Staphylococcus epidermidis]MCG1072141.1 hypothetical protein [Staphylococcus epidermidis]RNG65143.1 hypothetical protein D1G04_13860 [Staphylococcus aureus]RQN00774.1 hypothetical protein CPA43_01035 [Staphylococcus warneri]